MSMFPTKDDTINSLNNSLELMEYKVSSLEDQLTRLQDMYDSLVEKRRNEIKTLQANNRKRNLQLDALNFVWCNGGCKSGFRRWADKYSDEELADLLIEAQLNTIRLEEWIVNYLKKNEQD